MKSVLNNRGYMLVEIIVASAIALTMAFFLMEMTLKIVNSNNNYYEESVLLFDKNIVTKEIMDDINSKDLIEVVVPQTTADKSIATLSFNDNGTVITKDLVVEKKDGYTIITFGSYSKKLSDKLIVDAIGIDNDDNKKILTITIPAYTNYSKEDYGVSIVVPYKQIKISYPEIPVDDCDDLISKLGLSASYKDEKLASFTTDSTDADSGIYYTDDDFGKSCYFRGNIKNNYVKFGKHKIDWYKAVYENGDESELVYPLSECEDTSLYVYENESFTEYSGECEYVETTTEDLYWRIVRINGDGSIRMILEGIDPHERQNMCDNIYDDECFDSSSYYYRISNKFNDKSDSSAYVGYMYGDVNSDEYSKIHANVNDSIVKKSIDDWYKDVFLNTSYENYIVDSIYCNDRKVVTDQEKKSYTDKYFDNYSSFELYSFHNRVITNYADASYFGSGYYYNSEIYPSLKCEQVNDRFTVNKSLHNVEGNGNLTYPIGLITMDEVVFLGSYYNEFFELSCDWGTYLFSGGPTVTMTPESYVNGSDDSMLLSGSYDGTFVYDVCGSVFEKGDVTMNFLARPVISIKSNAIKKGTGSSSDPFRLE